jgi:hypothetical protein
MRELAKWIVEHGADRPEIEVEYEHRIEVGIPLVRRKPVRRRWAEVNYEVEM